jgi:hypothetical protein
VSDRDLCAERGFPGPKRQFDRDIASVDVKSRMLAKCNFQVQVAR